MRIRCLYCGPRGLDEFTYRGDATATRPQSADPSVQTGWIDYVYLRDNPTGWHREHWYHAAGCRTWLVVTRDVSTHRIVSVEFAANGGDASRSADKARKCAG